MNNDFKSLRRFVNRVITYSNLRPHKKKKLKLNLKNYKERLKSYFRTKIDLFDHDEISSNESFKSVEIKSKSKDICTYETDILLIGHQMDNESSEYSESGTDSSFQEEERYVMYNEKDIENFSEEEMALNQLQIPEVYNDFKHRDLNNRHRTYIRRISSIYLADQAMKNLFKDEEEEKMELNGDYILKRALLKDHDVKLLKTKEMQHVLSQCCKIHLGKDENGQKIIQVYKKPEVKDVTEEEINTIIINFLRDIRIKADPKQLLDVLDGIQQKIQRICPFGSMVKIIYKLETNKDVWFVPNREEVETGVVKIENFMKFFEEATEKEHPVLIKDIFTNDYQQEIPSFTILNGERINKSENLSEIWYNAMNVLSFATNSNLDKLPPEFYQWHCFAIPLKESKHDTMSKYYAI